MQSNHELNNQEQVTGNYPFVFLGNDQEDGIFIESPNAIMTPLHAGKPLEFSVNVKKQSSPFPQNKKLITEKGTLKRKNARNKKSNGTRTKLKQSTSKNNDHRGSFGINRETVTKLTVAGDLTLLPATTNSEAHWNFNGTTIGNPTIELGGATKGNTGESDNPGSSDDNSGDKQCNSSWKTQTGVCKRISSTGSRESKSQSQILAILEQEKSAPKGSEFEFGANINHQKANQQSLRCTMELQRESIPLLATNVATFEDKCHNSDNSPSGTVQWRFGDGRSTPLNAACDDHSSTNFDLFQSPDNSLTFSLSLAPKPSSTD